jgi:hypothetical protein
MSMDPGLSNSDSHYGNADCFACHEFSKTWREWDDNRNAHNNARGEPMQSCLPCHREHKDFDDADHKVQDKHSDIDYPAWYSPPVYDIDRSGDNVPDRYGKLGNCYYCHNVLWRSFKKSCGKDGFNPGGECTD